ncbi:glycosyltransferase family 2 protein [Synechococcus sp. AH-551-E11]|nr:glycosyltransferase family 2 protein [Synechococcus sp. AH-551-E11]MDB4616937.1 glycosyltransferase family 2 protein [Synechococcus sp. AH-551-E11]
MKLSICVPTYNREKNLKNCLQSINIASQGLDSSFRVEICISDNFSTDGTEGVVRDANLTLPVKYCKNNSNLGIPRNFLNVVDMAEGEFAWLIGDDDLLLPDAIFRLYELIDSHPGVDFFYVNSFHLNTEYLDLYPAPFDTANLPARMIPFSSWSYPAEMKFLDLIDPKISFDFLGGMFLSVFRKSLWDKNVDSLDHDAIFDNRTFSHFDNTFPHVKIFANAFSNSRAYFNDKPMNVCLTGAREWSPMYPFVHSVRLVEALDEYRKNGLPFFKYIYCKNYALNNFVFDFVKMFLARETSGYRYVDPPRLIAGYCLYPNFYLSFIYFLARLARKFLNPLRVFIIGLFS